MSDTDLLGKMKKDLKKSGYYSEMLAINAFKNRLWDVTGLASYLDLDKMITRESDLSALTVRSYKDENNTHAWMHYNIAAEVKKSANPWIIFKENPDEPSYLSEGWSQPIHKTGIPRKYLHQGLTDTLIYEGLSNEIEWVGSGIHEFNKNPDQPSRWFSALISVCKAAEHILLNNSSNDDDFDTPYIFFTKPVLILDGKLYSAELGDENNIDLSEIKYAPINFEFQTKNYTRGNYMVDIVTLKHLDEYISFVEGRIESIFTELMLIGDAKKNDKAYMKRPFSLRSHLFNIYQNLKYDKK